MTKFTTHLVSLDFSYDTATFYLPPGTRLGAGTYSIELQGTKGPDQQADGDAAFQAFAQQQMPWVLGEMLDDTDRLVGTTARIAFVAGRKSMAPPLDLLKRIRQHLPLAAACWNEDEDRKVADFHVAAVLALVKEIDAVIADTSPQIRGDVSPVSMQERQPFEPSDEQIKSIAEGMPGGLDGFLKGWGWQQFARKVLELRAPPTWEPQFDVMSPTQEALVQQYCAEIAGPKGEPGRPPDPVRLLEMAQELYLAERRECGP